MPALEVADIFRRHGEAYRRAHAGHLGRTERRVMGAIEACRTAALGGHVERCAGCGLVRISYNSCRNRHCPKCQGSARVAWLAERQAELLPVPYFHVVFTLPAPAAEIAFQNKAAVYTILFKAAAETLTTIAADPRHLGAEIGFIGVLHTWGQNLQHQPHVHCLVPGGGISPDGRRWIGCRPGFFLPVRVLSRLFRRLFLENLKAAFDSGKLAFFGALAELAAAPVFARRLSELRRAEWVVYAKCPFAGSAAALAYLGRYTHRVAISNSRLIDMTGDRVRFRWRDYRHHDKSKVMALAPMNSSGVSCCTPCRMAFTAFVITVFSAIVIAPRKSPFATSSSRSARLRRPAMLTSLDSLATTLSTSVLAAAGAWRCSARCRDHAQPIPRHGTTAHERRGLVPMVNRFAILATGCPRGAGVTRHAARAARLSLRAARTFGVAFVNGAPARRSPVTAPLPAGSRATRLLATSAFHSP